jgi:hypothetical protein
MQLYILDKDSLEIAKKLPLKYKKTNYAQKLLVEFGQLISSALGGKEVDDRLYKKLHRGKEIQNFILEHADWCWNYYVSLKRYCHDNYKNIDATLRAAEDIQYLLWNYAFISKGTSTLISNFADIPETAVFRYESHYECKIPTNTVLPIDECIVEYEKYLKWKFREELQV